MKNPDRMRGRTNEKNDIRPLAKISQREGIAVDVGMFLGDQSPSP